jgi:hypothetical protein
VGCHTRAQQIAADLPVGSFDPQPWFGWLGAIGLDEAHIPVVDLTRPIIAVRIREADGAVMIITVGIASHEPNAMASPNSRLSCWMRTRSTKCGSSAATSRRP